jgi:hypothetical protein
MTSQHGPQRALLRLAPEPAAVLKAAHTVRAACRNAGLPDQVTQNSATLASRLVALSTHQAHSDIEVRIDIIGPLARVEIAGHRYRARTGQFLGLPADQPRARDLGGRRMSAPAPANRHGDRPTPPLAPLAPMPFSCAAAISMVAGPS